MKSPPAKTSSRLSSQGADPVRGVLDSIRRIVRVLRLASRDAEKRVGLSAAQLFVLQKLAEGEVLSVNDLAGRTHTHQSSVSVVVQRLVERGMVARSRSPRDGRQMDLSVTPAGKTALRSAPSAAQERLIAALAALPEREQRQLASSLHRLVEGLGVDGDSPAEMLFEEEGPRPPSTGGKRRLSNPRAPAGVVGPRPRRS